MASKCFVMQLQSLCSPSASFFSHDHSIYLMPLLPHPRPASLLAAGSSVAMAGVGGASCTADNGNGEKRGSEEKEKRSKRKEVETKKGA